MDAASGSFTCAVDSADDEWTYFTLEGNYTVHVDLAELHGRVTLDNGESYDRPVGVDLEGGRTYQMFGTGQARATGVSECRLEITDWVYATEEGG